MERPERDPDRVHRLVADVLDHDSVFVPGPLHEIRGATGPRLHDDDAGRIVAPAEELERQLGDRSEDTFPVLLNPPPDTRPEPTVHRHPPAGPPRRGRGPRAPLRA